MVYSISGIKGGSGRSTTAANLFVFLEKQGRKVLAVDADEQQSFSYFLGIRDDSDAYPSPNTMQLFGEDLLPKLKPVISQYDDVVIDCGGRDSAAQRAALTLADACLVPVTPRSTDRWTLDAVYKLLHQARQFNPKLQAFLFFSRTDFRGLNTTAVTYALDYLQEETDWCRLVELPIGNRVAYDKAIGQGESVLEFEPADTKARAEVTALFTHVQQAITPSK
jgi:chromosome partitioning protein